jgi:hypothetical protein
MAATRRPFLLKMQVKLRALFVEKRVAAFFFKNVLTPSSDFKKSCGSNGSKKSIKVETRISRVYL